MSRNLCPPKNSPDKECEIWKDSFIKNIKVSNFGRFINTKTKKRPKFRTRVSGEEYLPENGGSTFLAAELILLAFSEEPKNSFDIKYIDGDIKNLAASNLRWVSFNEDFIENINGFKGYFISTSGEVFSNREFVNRKKWTKIKPNSSYNKRPFVALRDENGIMRQRYVAPLVLEAHGSKRPVGMQCCHNDGNVLNNHIDNLRWDTPSNNNRDKIKHGTRQCGEKAGTSKFKEWQVKEILLSDKDIPWLMNEYKCSKSTIVKIKNKKSWAYLHETNTF